MLDTVKKLHPGLNFKELNGVPVIAGAGDLNREYRLIREDVGILPLTFAEYVRIDGEENEERLDTLFTKSVQFLNYGQNRIGYFLNEAGNALAIVVVYKNDEGLLLEFFKWDERAVLGSLESAGISFSRLDFRCLLFEGPRATEFLGSVLGADVDYFVYQGHQEIECGGHQLLVARTGYTGEYGYKLIGEPAKLEGILNALLPGHADKIAGVDAYTLCQFEVKQPFWTLPYRALSENLFETDYQWLVDFKKDTAYRGKENLYAKAAAAGNRIIGAFCDSELPAGESVLLDNESIGRVIDCAFSIGLQKYIVMLFAGKEFAHANLSLTTASNIAVTTVSAPYVFPTSWSVNK